MGTLYLVATPIGNLEDVTLRALRVLGQVDLIAAEDTRTTRKLLLRHGLRTRLTSYHEHNRRQKTPLILKALERGSVALVSEAGTPGISDPGRELVVAAVEQGILVVPVPGPSVVTAAVAASGLPSDAFTFLGFLPRRDGERRRLLASVAGETHTLVFFEAPHRMRKALQDMLDVLGDRRLAVCRELTKLHEEVFRGTVSQALAHFAHPIGEFTLVVEGGRGQEAGSKGQGTGNKGPEWAREELRRLKAQGLGARQATEAVAKPSGLPRRQAYRLWLELP